MRSLATPADWSVFLKQYAEAIHAKEWPGNPPSTESQLASAEKRLKIKLPPSYRAFLSATNGWRQATRSIPVLRPVEEVRWFRKEHPDWVRAYLDPMQGDEQILPSEQDYFSYSEEDSLNFDVKHLRHTLCISEVGDSAVLLLNSMVVWPDGEWEAWFFADWLPGASRYRSFPDWMRYELARLFDETFEQKSKPGELPTVFLDGPTKAHRRVRPREETPTLDVALERLASKTRSHRVKAVQQLCRIGGPDGISVLLNVLRDDFDFHVRTEAAEALGRLQADEAIETLITIATQASRISSAAVRALGDFRDESGAECLLRLVEEDGPQGCVAAHALARRGDARAVAPLVQKLISKDAKDQSTGNIAGRLIAAFQEPGLLALKPLMNDPDREIRSRAINGMTDLALLARDNSLKTKAREVLRQSLEGESDGSLRQWLARCVEMFSKKRSSADGDPFSKT